MANLVVPSTSFQLCSITQDYTSVSTASDQNTSTPVHSHLGVNPIEQTELTSWAMLIGGVGPEIYAIVGYVVPSFCQQKNCLNLLCCGVLDLTDGNIGSELYHVNFDFNFIFIFRPMTKI